MLQAIQELLVILVLLDTTLRIVYATLAHLSVQDVKYAIMDQFVWVALQVMLEVRVINAV